MPTSHWPGLLAVPVMLASACRSPATGAEDARQAIVAREQRALTQWAEGNTLGYLEVDADDVTYFDDIGAHSLINGKEALRAYFTSLRGRIPAHRYEMVEGQLGVPPGPRRVAHRSRPLVAGEGRRDPAHQSVTAGSVTRRARNDPEACGRSTRR